MRILSIEQVPIILWSPSAEQAEQDCACGGEGLAPTTLYSSPADRSSETDCACPNDGLYPQPIASFDVTAHWQCAPELYHISLSGDYTLFFNPLCEAGVIVLNKAAKRILDAFASPCRFDQVVATLPDLATSDVQHAVGQLVQLGLLQLEGATPQPQRPAPHTLTAWLHVTNACNLDCAYCYVEKSNQAMDDVTGRAAVDAVFRSAVRHGFRAVKLKYSGGEPTLNFGLVQNLHSYASEVAKRKDLELREVLLSNGAALTDPMLDFIAKTGMRLMISLDGVGATHDTQRAFADGQGTFGRVSQGIDRALVRGIAPYLSITVTGQNLGGLADTVAFALERDLLFNLNFYRPNDHTVSSGDLPPHEADLIAAIRMAFAAIEDRLPRHSLMAGLLDRAHFDYPHDRVCGAGRSYMVIDQHGWVTRCQMEMRCPVAHIWQEDPLGAIRSKQTGFRNVPVDGKEDCATCMWRYVCAGGCPMFTYWITGRSDVKSPYCGVYRTLYPEALRLEGLRLLK